jgi:hypothetical protein
MRDAHLAGLENMLRGIKADASHGQELVMPVISQTAKDWIFTAYRPLWIVLNLALIFVTLVDWANSEHWRIKVDLPNIKAQTAKVVTKGDAADKLVTDFGFKTRSSTGLDFCQWAADETVKAYLKEPFKTLDCADAYSISLKQFQAYDMHTYPNAANTTVWDIYAYGEPGVDGELFTNDATIAKPANDILKPYLKDNGIYLGPRECTTKKLQNFKDWILAFGILVIVYFVLHIAHWIAGANTAEENTMQILDRIVLGWSVIVYILAIALFFMQDQNKLFTECAWISTWFQQNYVTLYGSNITYVVTGFIGLAFCVIHCIAVSYNYKADATLYNLVVGNSLIV